MGSDRYIMKFLNVLATSNMKTVIPTFHYNILCVQFFLKKIEKKEEVKWITLLGIFSFTLFPRSSKL